MFNSPHDWVHHLERVVVELVILHIEEDCLDELQVLGLLDQLFVLFTKGSISSIIVITIAVFKLIAGFLIITESVVQRLEALAISDKRHLNHFFLPTPVVSSDHKAIGSCLEDLVAIVI